MLRGRVRREAAETGGPEPAAEVPPATPPRTAGTQLKGDIIVEPKDVTEVIGGKRYRTQGAEMLANDMHCDGRSNERIGRNTFLFRTPKGAYFMLLQSTWPLEHDVISPLARDEALRIFEELPAKSVDFEVAFPGITIEDA